MQLTILILPGQDIERRAFFTLAQRPKSTNTWWCIYIQTGITTSYHLTLSPANREAGIHDFLRLPLAVERWIWVIRVIWGLSCLSCVCHHLTYLKFSIFQGVKCLFFFPLLKPEGEFPCTQSTCLNHTAEYNNGSNEKQKRYFFLDKSVDNPKCVDN